MAEPKSRGFDSLEPPRKVYVEGTNSPMTSSNLGVQTQSTLDPSVKQIVNDFSIQIATVNGSGSQSANSVLLRSIFRMGIPVSGKNLFPSNIAGLPTWYTIRVSKHGWVARNADIDAVSYTHLTLPTIYSV